jgi:hypothetical protein
MSLTTLLLRTSVPVISAEELDEELKNGNRPFLLDVRQPQEYQLGHIPGAKLIPLGSLGKRLNEVPKDREIVCICATGAPQHTGGQQIDGGGNRSQKLEKRDDRLANW